MSNKQSAEEHESLLEPKSRRTFVEVAGFILILLATLLPRILALDRFATPDEYLWLTRSANFYTALARGDISSTFQREHPGVTTMWAGTAGFLSEYTRYPASGLGQADEDEFHAFVSSSSKSLPMRLLTAGRVFMVLGSTLALLLAYLYARRLIGLIPALCGFLLIAFDPFHLALTRLLHLDGFLSNLMLLSLLAYLSYLQERKFLHLVISGIAAGLAWLTKSPGALLLPAIFSISLFDLWQMRSTSNHTSIKKQLWGYTWPVITWVGVGILIFVVLWPAMWVKPLQSITSIFNMATGYAESGHGAGVFFYGTVTAQSNNLLFYPASFLWRTTPIVILGLVAAAWGFITKRKPFNDSGAKLTLLGLLLMSLFFTIGISLGAKKIDRYLLPVLVPLDLIAGMGWASLIFWINERELPILKRYWGYLVLTLVIGIQMVLSLRTYPYYFPYYNPLMGGGQRAPYAMKVGWGEGLEQAARYLNQKPKAKGLRVFSWYADGPFSYFFIGRSRRMWLDDEVDETRWQRFLNSDYAVTYINQWQRNLPEQVLEYLSPLEPEHTIWINGIEYIRIYKLP
ncbi:MAG: glycosyltransferase family 39 protein [Anaerolineales bacterium]|jgi:hypothetical protein